MNGMWRDKSTASLSGSSQTLAPLNGSRVGLIVQNTGNANVGVNITGGTAAIGGVGTITLPPPAATGTTSLLIFTGDGTPQGAINVIGTGGQPCACLEL